MITLQLDTTVDDELRASGPAHGVTVTVISDMMVRVTGTAANLATWLFEHHTGDVGDVGHFLVNCQVR